LRACPPFARSRGEARSTGRIVPLRGVERAREISWSCRIASPLGASGARFYLRRARSAAGASATCGGIADVVERAVRRSLWSSRSVKRTALTSRCTHQAGRPTCGSRWWTRSRGRAVRVRQRGGPRCSPRRCARRPASCGRRSRWAPPHAVGRSAGISSRAGGCWAWATNAPGSGQPPGSECHCPTCAMRGRAGRGRGADALVAVRSPGSSRRSSWTSPAGVAWCSAAATRGFGGRRGPSTSAACWAECSRAENRAGGSAHRGLAGASTNSSRVGARAVR
jgi:hypothetical protein